MRAARLLQFHWNLYLEQKTEKERAANEGTGAIAKFLFC